MRPARGGYKKVTFPADNDKDKIDPPV